MIPLFPVPCGIYSPLSMDSSVQKPSQLLLILLWNLKVPADPARCDAHVGWLCVAASKCLGSNPHRVLKMSVGLGLLRIVPLRSLICMLGSYWKLLWWSISPEISAESSQPWYQSQAWLEDSKPQSRRRQLHCSLMTQSWPSVGPAGRKRKSLWQVSLSAGEIYLSKMLWNGPWRN